ncbi:MAG: nickel-dependent lactate racemase [Lentisphaeria bacterium]|jgi:nickel-dependent lactate racemase
MAQVSVPYAKSAVTFTIPDENLVGIFESSVHHCRPAAAGLALVEEALARPIGSEALASLARGKRRAVIIISDHTRPVPSRAILPPMLRQLREGNPAIDITLLVSTGLHRATTADELRQKLGDEIYEHEKIVVHDSRDKSSLCFLGILPSGGELWINKLAVDCDLLLAEGFIEPHFFAGFSGGRKSVLPGIAGTATVLANHCSEFIQSPSARTGVLAGNPLHRDMLWAARQARLAFIVNVVINGAKEVIQAFAGDSVAAHNAGCEYLRELCQIEVPPADIIITSNGGYPLDQNIYQAVKGMTAGEFGSAPGTVIILAAACNDGHGGEQFYRFLAEAASPAELLARLAKVPQAETLPDQWESQVLARILSQHRVILLSDQCDPAIIRGLHLEAALTPAEALAKAFAIKGKDARVAVIPDGVSVIATYKAGG